MTIAQLRELRLLNQQIAKTSFAKPEQIVHWLGAMQAQDYGMAKWAIGLRIPGSRGKDVEDAFNQGLILRTHLLRPTWHFVSPEDIRWMLLLTAPRVHALNDYYYRKSELDGKILKRSNEVLVKSLEGCKHLTRNSLQTLLAKSKIKAEGVRLGYIMMQAELDGIICSGPRLGLNFSYALLEERVPKIKNISREEALGKLMDRYFRSRGPATLSDFVWWSGLTMKDAKTGSEMLDKDFITEEINGHQYIFIPSNIKLDKQSQTSFLLPDYDEYGISYKDRSAIINKFAGHLQPTNGVFPHSLIIDGMMAGKWTIVKKNKEAIIETHPYKPLNKRQDREIVKAVDRFTSFRQFLSVVHVNVVSI